MTSLPKRLFRSETELQEVLQNPRHVARGTHEAGVASEAAHFVAGAFLRDGFRLFRNGGTPLLERREGPLVEEIVLQPGGDPCFLTTRLHLSHLGLREIRSRYWTTPARAPTNLAGGNVGELEIPPGWVLWDVSEEETLSRLTDWLYDLAIPWFALFEDPNSLRLSLRSRGVPLMSDVNALEWLICEFGRREARSFYEEIVTQGIDRYDPETRERLRALEVCFRLAYR